MSPKSWQTTYNTHGKIILDPSTRQRGTRRRVFSDGITKSSIWSGTVSENPSFEKRFRIDVFPQLATLKQIHQMYHLPKIKSSYRASTSTEYSDMNIKLNTKNGRIFGYEQEIGRWLWNLKNWLLNGYRWIQWRQWMKHCRCYQNCCT